MKCALGRNKKTDRGNRRIIMPENSSCSSASSCSRESCEGCPSAKGGSGIEKEPMNAASNVKKVIGVVSGKGGVGKSTLCVGLGKILSEHGHKTLLIDMDIGARSLDLLLNVAEKIKSELSE